MRSALRVLALSPYPALLAGPRYRLFQLVDPLRRHQVEMRIITFLDDQAAHALYAHRNLGRAGAGLATGSLRMALGAISSLRYDVVLVHREATLLGPPFAEWLAMAVGRRPLVLDIDDAIWEPGENHAFPRLAALRRWPNKAEWLIQRAALVTCGSQVLVRQVMDRGRAAIYLPNALDLTRFAPKPAPPRPPQAQDLLTLGWIGSPSTFGYLAEILPILRSLFVNQRFRLRVVGSGHTALGGATELEIEFLPFDMRREVDDFRSLDVGLYPLGSDPYAVGKSALKAIQYMAVGVPFVASPVGMMATLGEAGETHFLAREPRDWEPALAWLLQDSNLRRRMGVAGRAYARAHHSVEHAARSLASALFQVAGEARSQPLRL